MRYPEPPERPLILTSGPPSSHRSRHARHARPARAEDACYHNVSARRVSALRTMPSSQEKGAVRPGLEHEGAVLRRTLLALLLALIPGVSRAQSPTPDGGTATGPGTSDAPRLLHLNDAVQAAVQNQPQLIQARASASAAEGRVIQARSPLLPQVTPQASWTRSYRALTSVGTGGTGTTPNAAQCASSTCNTWRFGVAGSQTLWDPSTWAGWE